VCASVWGVVMSGRGTAKKRRAHSPPSGQIAGVRFRPLALLPAAFCVALAFACGGGGGAGFTPSGFDGGDGNGGSSDGATSPDGDLFALDGAASDAPPVNVCKVQDEDQGSIPTCTKQAPPNAFTPTVKWKWTAPQPAGGGVLGSMVTPLVANLTDDNHDGAIDLCDVPDVLIATGGGPIHATGQLVMLAGDSGKVEFTFAEAIDSSVNPALGDIDGDGNVDIVAADPQGHLLAWEHDGKLKWRSATVAGYYAVEASYCNALALYDLDGDGAVEILAAFEVFDNKGNRKFGVAGNEAAFDHHYWCPTPTAADLDGDGKLEVVFGNVAMHADGSPYWTLAGPPGQPHVANLDADPEPEIFIAREDGLLVLEHDGTVKFGPIELTQKITSPNCYSKPGAIHDFDGDGIADIAAASCNDYSVYHVTPTTLTLAWSAPVSDQSGLATGTAFDFLGRGAADAVYADETKAYAFAGKNGKAEFTVPRSSATLIEYPVVADVDNDGSADVVVVSNGASGDITCFQDAQRRWIPSRRIWNQHAYHVTNVLEDGRIPKKMKNSWQLLNTFRTNAQLDVGGACKPPTVK
jgi:FG-GAP-like repeat